MGKCFSLDTKIWLCFLASNKQVLCPCFLPGRVLTWMVIFLLHPPRSYKYWNFPMLGHWRAVHHTHPTPPPPLTQEISFVLIGLNVLTTPKYPSLPDLYSELCVHLCLIIQLCPTLCNFMDCSPPGSSAHGISQARILEWVAFPPPGDFPDPRIKPRSPGLAGGFFTTAPPGKPHSEL